MDSGTLVAELKKIELVEALKGIEQRLRDALHDGPLGHWNGTSLRVQGQLCNIRV